jgi:hypothetical protein
MPDPKARRQITANMRRVRLAYDHFIAYNRSRFSTHPQNEIIFVDDHHGKTIEHKGVL